MAVINKKPVKLAFLKPKSSLFQGISKHALKASRWPTLYRGHDELNEWQNMRYINWLLTIYLLNLSYLLYSVCVHFTFFTQIRRATAGAWRTRQVAAVAVISLVGKGWNMSVSDQWGSILSAQWGRRRTVGLARLTDEGPHTTTSLSIVSWPTVTKRGANTSAFVSIRSDGVNSTCGVSVTLN